MDSPTPFPDQQGLSAHRWALYQAIEAHVMVDEQLRRPVQTEQESFIFSQEYPALSEAAMAAENRLRALVGRPPYVKGRSGFWKLESAAPGSSVADVPHLGSDALLTAIAIEVMGWTNVKVYHLDRADHQLMGDDPAGFRRLLPPWIDRLSGSWEIVERMTELGWQVNTTHLRPSYQWSDLDQWRFYRDQVGGTAIQVAESGGGTVHEACARAALIAVRLP